MVSKRKGWGFSTANKHVSTNKFLNLRTRKDRNMDKAMGSSVPTEKLERINYASWVYKMHQYLVGHGYWSYIKGPRCKQSSSRADEQRFPGLGVGSKPCLVLPSILCLCPKHHNPEVAAPPRAQQCPTKRYVSHWLHHQDEADLWLTRIHQCFDRQRRDGTNLFRWSSTEIWAYLDEYLHEGEAAVLFQPLVNTHSRGEQHGCINKHASRQQDVVHGGRLAPWSWRMRGSTHNGGDRQE